MPPSRILVLGASAGGVEAVSAVIAGMTPELRVPVLVVIHTALSDGVAGLRAIKLAGGRDIVQNPEEAQESERQAEYIRQLLERSAPPATAAIGEPLGKQLGRRRRIARTLPRRKATRRRS
jgi:chemotaxis response regulator CheB